MSNTLAVRTNPLMPALFALTAVTGLVDAVSVIGLGRVFVANMTGNVAFLAFALAGDQSFSAPRSLAAAAAFLLGALIGGRFASRLVGDRRRWLVTAFTAELTLVALAAVIAATADASPAVAYVLIALLGIGLGVQNATVRRLAVPDMTTTVLTLTMTGLAADSTPAGGSNPNWGRRSAAVLVMFGGAAIGALLVLDATTAWSLAVAAVLLAGATWLCSRLPYERT